MLELIGTIVTVIAVAGAVLNNHRRRMCFVLWIVSNLASGAMHGYLNCWSLAARDFIFFVLAVQGWMKWRTADKR